MLIWGFIKQVEQVPCTPLPKLSLYPAAAPACWVPWLLSEVAPPPGIIASGQYGSFDIPTL